MSEARNLAMHDVLRYASTASAAEAELDGLLNFHYVTSDPQSTGLPILQLSRGIWATSPVIAADGERRGVIALRSTPWNAGGEFNPWHDEFDLDHGHVRYFGDHRVDTLGFPGATLGNRMLMEAWGLHSASSAEARALAPPLLLFRSTTAVRGGRTVTKGQVEFCGVGIIERLEHVVLRDPKTGRSFPNIAIDVAVVDLSAEGDAVDMRWIDARRDGASTADEALARAPVSWRRWVREGRSAIPRVRRRPMSSRVKKREEQLPVPGSEAESMLHQIYEAFHGRKHAFELLAARVAASVLGAQYTEGWLTRSGGDGGVDFVGRMTIGSPSSNTPIVVLGQAKCVEPETSISADQVARVVARLRRGWVGVYVTTGHFSKQAQVEVIDDQYPLVLVPGLDLADHVGRMAAADYDGSLSDLLEAMVQGYEGAVTHRRPEEILTG